MYQPTPELLTLIVERLGMPRHEFNRLFIQSLRTPTGAGLSMPLPLTEDEIEEIAALDSQAMVDRLSEFKALCQVRIC